MVSGSYLAMIDIDSMKFKWSTKMAFTDCGVFGMWSWLDKNSVYIMPNRSSDSLAEFIKSGDFKPKSKEEKMNAEASLDWNENSKKLKKFKSLDIDEDIVNLVEFLCENNGTVLATLFHELYHKFQYVSNPVLYVINSGFFRLLGYALSTKIDFSIEGDVRKYVDNEVLWNSITDFLSIFNTALKCLDTIESLKKDFEEIENGISSLSEEECQRIKKTYKEAYDKNLILKVGESTRRKYKLAERIIKLALRSN